MLGLGCQGPVLSLGSNGLVVRARISQLCYTIKMCAGFNTNSKLIFVSYQVMPNTPCLVGETAAGYAEVYTCHLSLAIF
jgi:hypothetical protein